ncbi:hypothetical protein M0R45_025273 [Rubus argutus]|uniref:Dihydropteroate synthase n=1 Tax=Rubus argutus TaxID=59490 RepID=A0AAW1WWM2_RUBAR
MHIFKQLLPTISRLNGAKKYFQASCSAFIHSCPNSTVEVHSQDQEVVIALGSNVGDRLHNFNEALQLMRKSVKSRSEILSIPHEKNLGTTICNSPINGFAGSAIDSDVVLVGILSPCIPVDFLSLGKKLGGDSLIGKEGLKRVVANWKWLVGLVYENLNHGYP